MLDSARSFLTASWQAQQQQWSGQAQQWDCVQSMQNTSGSCGAADIHSHHLR
jgi:hypothetical protein